MPIHGYPGNVITANPTAPTVSSASGVWTTEQQLINQSAGRWPMAATQISRSLRFNSADSAYLNRTPASASNRKTWTWSGWVKRSVLARQMIFTTPDGTYPTGAIEFNSTNNITWIDYTSVALGYALELTTTQVFRDVSAWYHLVFVFDTTQATSSNRAKFYVNGTQVTTFSASTYPSQNYDGAINTATQHRLGSQSNRAAQFLDAYLTEVNFIDGLALDPSYFGFNNSDTGVWTPRQYTGAYGTNGFYLNFSDNSNTTAATLGKDYSGNGNNWTPNNFSVTAGAGNDSLVDSPTSYGTDTGAGGEVRGNYCTLNPLNKNTSGTLSNGNLEWQASTTSIQGVTGTSTIIPSGKTYFELNVVTAAGSGTFYQVGIVPPGKDLTSSIGSASGNGYAIEQNQADNIQLRLNGSSITVSTVVQTGDVLQVAVDYATGKLWFGRNNTWYNSSGGTTGNPAAGTNETATISTTTDWFPAVVKYNTGGSYAINFGQRAFSYTAPSGFKALCTQNLPTPTIGATSTTQANDYMNVVLYTGTGSSLGVTGVGFQPDWVWIKGRSGATDHGLYDAVRGVQKQLESNTTTAETTETTGLTAFGTDGFTVGALAQLNTSSATYVAWNWKANGAGSSNTAGTITSTVSASTTSGFSIVTYTGNGSAGATIGHGLGVAPSMIIIRCRNSGAVSWGVYHASVGNTAGLYLNLDFAAATTSIFWNNTSPTSSVFSVGNWAGVNGNTDTYVAYCFAPVAGYSAFGSYTGNGSTDGPFVYTGFRPEYVVVKRTNDTGNWTILDNARSTANPTDEYLWANLTAAEVANLHAFDFLSNGFKLRNTTSDHNSNGSTYIYMAFAEFPFKYALAR
jgi:hypothetical protein